MREIINKINKKSIIIISTIIILSIVIIRLYNTLAILSNETITYNKTDNVFELIIGDISDKTYSTTIGKNDTKDIDIVLENKEEIDLNYLLYYSTLLNNKNIEIGVLSTSKNKGIDTIKNKSVNTVSLRIINNSNYDEDITFGVIYGYVKGGELTPKDDQIKIDKIIKEDSNLDKSGANKPNITSRMIPIYYDNYNKVWKKADESNNDESSKWYDYNNKEWANVVLKNNNTIIDISNNLNNAINVNGNWNKDKGIISTNNGYIDCGLSNYYFGSKLSIVSKVKLYDKGTIISNLSNNKGFSIEYNKNNDKYNITTNIYSTNNDKLNTLNTTINTSNDWYIIALTFNGDLEKDNLNLYINGSLVGTTSINGNITISDKNLTIGNNIDINNIIIFSNELKSEDINKYYNKDIIVNDYKYSILHYNFLDGVDIPNGTIISDSDDKGTLLFLTWIPRYKYRVWNINKEDNSYIYTTDDGIEYNAYNKGIDIVFEKNNNTTGTITCAYKINNNNEFLFISDDTNNSTLSENCIGNNYDYYTHPAFKNKEGFWISKFEISGTESTPLSLPNKKSLDLDLNTSFNSSLNITTNNIYDINNNNFNSHLIKNTEWGAVSYLTHSIYGLCDGYSCNDVKVNNSTEFYTGRSSGTDINTEELKPNKYGNYNYLGYIIDNNTGNITTNIDSTKISSTTNNVYGVYDMAGGREEYAMGIMATINGNINPLFNTILKSIDNNYYNTYSYSNESNTKYSYNRSILGDATGEIVITNNIDNGLWYNHYNNFLNNNQEILLRGGSSLDINKIGQLTFNATPLSNNNKYSSRIVIN